MTSFLVLAVSLSAADVPNLTAAQSKGGTALRAPVTAETAEAIELTNGWALLTEGKAEQALVRADRVLATNPRSVAAFVLGIESELVRGGSSAALGRYERWVGSRPLEEPSVLRRIAVGLLRESGANQTTPGRVEALRALAEEGDPAAIAALQQRVKASSLAEARVLARMGDEAAVKILIEDVKRTGGRSMSAIEALGASGSSLAVTALSEQLTHGFPEIRGAAVEGLGKLGAKHSTASRIKPLLNDPVTYVRVKAAAALLALGDVSGLQFLQELAAQPSPSGRLMAAQAMASQPSGEWQEMVRQLTAAPEPEVRVGAATLLLPYQPEIARQVLEAARNDPNPAIRNLASESLADAVAPTDLRVLRQMLRAADSQVRVRAAARILHILR